MPDRSRTRRRHSRTRHGRDFGCGRSMRGCRSRRAVPRRSRRDERRSGKSSGSRPSGTPARARRGDLRPRQARRRLAFVRPPAHAALAVRTRGRRSCDLVSRRRGRACGRRRVDRAFQSDRKIAGELAAPWSARSRFSTASARPAARPRLESTTRAHISTCRRRRNFRLATACPTAALRSSICNAIRARPRPANSSKSRSRSPTTARLTAKRRFSCSCDDLVASVARPLLELKGVRKIVLKARERGRATWRLPTGDLSFLGPNLNPVLEPGRFEIHVGQSADPAGLLTEVIELTP